MAKTDASFATLEGSEHSDIPQPVPTLGTAIDSVSSKLTSAGMALHFPVTCHSKRQPGKPSGTVIRLPTMILLGITHFREISNAKDWSIGELADYPGEALVPGNVVALYDIANRCFLRVWNDSADYNGGWKQVTELSLEMDSERFLVVDAGAGCIALYNPRHRRFLCCQKDGSLSRQVRPSSMSTSSLEPTNASSSNFKPTVVNASG